MQLRYNKHIANKGDNMLAQWPQLTLIILIAMGLGISIIQHGKAKDGTHNAWVEFAAQALTIWLLYEGGFFIVK